MQRSTPSVAHEDLAQLAEPRSCRLEELQNCIREARHIVRRLEEFAPWRWILHVLLNVILRVKVHQVVLGGLRKHHARLVTVLFRIVDDVDLLLPG